MSDENLVTAFVNSDGNYQIVTDGPGAKCPACGWPERHRVFSEPDDPSSKMADGCPACESPHQSTELEHGA